MERNEIAQILCTNSPPNPGEVVALKSRMDGLADTISQMRSRLLELETEFDGYRGATSAIRRIPSEVLGQVFLLLSPSAQELVNIGLVCKRWREATLLTHRIWSAIMLAKPRELSGSSYDRIVTWFGRSGTTPRKLKISEAYNHGGKCGPGDCHLLNPTLVKLLTEGPSIDTLSLLCKGRYCFRRLLKAISRTDADSTLRPWKTIRALKLEFDNDSPWITRDLESPRRERIFNSLPSSITSLSLHLPPMCEAFNEPSMSQLVDLNVPVTLLKGLIRLKIVCDWQGGHILKMLEACENLEDLEIDVAYSELELGPADADLFSRMSVSGIVLGKLRTLAFRDQANLDYLQYLTAPALAALDIGFERCSHAEEIAVWDFHDPLKSFVDRSKCQETLKILRLYDTPFSPGELAAIVLNLPCLNHLTLDNTPVPWFQFFEILNKRLNALRASGNTRFPPLKALELLRVSQQASVIEAAFHFLCERGPGSCQLVVSYESLPKIPDETRIASNWGFVTSWHETPSSKSLQEFGITVSIVPPSTNDRLPSPGSMDLAIPTDMKTSHFNEPPWNPSILLRTTMTEPGLSHILSSNTPPNQAEIDLLESRIVDLTGTIHSLTEQLQQLETERLRHRKALSAIRRIPPEILGKIFTLILQLPLGTEGRDQLVNLSTVCRSWRNAALLTHRLWSSIDIHPRELSSQSYDKIVLWLDRSGGLPRRLEIAEVWGEEYQGWCSGDSDDCHLLKPIVLQLLSSGPSISDLVVESKGPECFSRLMNALNEAQHVSERRPWDSIQSLDVFFAGDAGWTLETLIEDRHECMFTDLPPVTSLSLWFPSADDAFNDPLHSGKVHFDIRPSLLENLTHFTICCDWEGAHILSALQHCPNLEVLEVDLFFEDLHFRVSERELERHLSDNGVRLPKLHTLRLRHQDELGLLRYLITPAFTTLDIGFDGQSEKADLLGNKPRRLHHGAILREFVHGRSHCQETLTKLRLFDAAFSPGALIELLLDLPSLTHLILDHVYFNLHQFWTSLQSKTIQSRYNPTARKCLPRLEALELLRVEVHTPSAPPILAAMFGFLLDRGRPCRVTMSFENHRVLNESWATNIWTLLCEENEVALGERGIFLRVVRPVTHGSDS